MDREPTDGKLIDSKLIDSKLIDDCFRPDQPRLRHGDAVALLKARLSPLSRSVEVDLACASGRILAQAIAAGHPVPAHTNAAVDGYAFRATPDVCGSGGILPVTGRAAAGHPLTTTCGDSAVRIFTGAVMPAGSDTVVMQEDVTLLATAPPAGLAQGHGAASIRIPAGLKSGANVRKAGEDVAAGATLFARGDTLRPQDLAALASIGRARVPCYEQLRVAIVATGDEVVAASAGGGAIAAQCAPLAPGEVYDANSPMLAALAALAGARVETLGIWPDQRETVTRRLQDAAARFDVILTSGGASLGEEDHMARALDAIGTRHLWQLAIKPGRPMMFGQIASGAGNTGTDARVGRRDTIVVGLPGNPVAVFVCFLMYVYPLLKAASGATWPEPRRFPLPAAFEFTGRKQGRREFWRARLIETPAGMAVEKFPRDGSGLISGLRWSNGLIDIPEDHGDIARGDPVAFIPYAEFGIV